MEDNKLGDWYYYVITVITGIAPNAGTNSNAFIILTGENHETAIRSLSDGTEDVSKNTFFINLF